MSISLVKDSGKTGDNLTNDAHINLGFDLANGAVTYTLKSIVKGKEKVIGKAGTSFDAKLLDDAGNFLLPATSKAGQYVLEVKQGEVASSLSFTVDNKLPSALKIAIANDTGKKSDKITNDATLKLTGLETGATVEWYNSTAKQWQTVATDLLTVDGKTTLLKTGDLLTGDFKGTLELRQVDAAGNAQKAATKVVLTYDTTAPEVLNSSVPSEADSIANGKSSVVRIISNEKLIGLDKSDFVVSNTALASVGAIKEVVQKDGTVAYDVTLTASKTGGGDVSLSFAKNAAVTDVAGNALNVAALAEEALAGFWIGNGNLQVSLVEDTGKAGDYITNNGDINISAIRSDSAIEFRIKANSESLPEGSIDWIDIEGLVIDGTSETISIESLYELANLSLENSPVDGWKDTIEFRQVNELTGKTSGSTALTFTYDNYADMFFGESPESDEVANGQSVVLQFTSDEKLAGFDKSDLMVTNAALASITGVKEQMVTEDDWVYWNYNVTVKAGATDGEVGVQFADSASITDLAGNEIDLAAIEPYLLFIV
ncbi:MAG: hypothetical protein RL122_554 [Pseudomonadota bacterium]|jgi:hypothetical protein|uniref:Bacterial Ig-like domain-containing protein n=1 Tax=Thiothrix fructosivorans TaxID=111770 RepID=A0A8B0SDP8_9GAMM|nr:Ig-like domain-containing protein [Thiothrix fructosivorans]MBO0614339.1 hypothetical protein [Thiothrix fructosivorans]QTX09184.1 hypothetical protein J1836_011045 [Thiothrix fructosivorans]